MDIHEITPVKFGEEIINANRYFAWEDDLRRVGIFCYLLNPPGVQVRYSIGITDDKGYKDIKIDNIDTNSFFLDTLLEEPLPDYYYYVAADYNDTLRKFRQVYMTVLK